MDPARPAATRLGVWRGRVAGLDEEVDGLRARRVVDLGGATVLPGFVDAHSHLAWTGMVAGLVDLSACRTRDAVLDAIRRAADAAACTGNRDGWVDLAGYDQRPLGGHLTRDDLELAAPGRKVYVRHASGHACLVSDAVLATVTDDEFAAHAPGVVRDAAGRPTGLLEEGAMAIARARRLPYGLDEIVAAIETAGRECLAQGITTVAEAGIVTDLAGSSPVELAAYQVAREQGRLPVRVQAMIPAAMLRPSGAAPGDGIARAIDLGLRTGLGDDRLSVGALKLWLDGGMMARTAALTEPYLNPGGSDTSTGDDGGSGGSGRLAFDDDELAALVLDAHRAGWQLAVHAIGDAAVDQAIAVVAAAQATHPRPDARHRVEHCGIVRPDQLPRLAAAGLTAVIQPTFLHAFGDDYSTIMGPERTGWMYRGRSFLDHGITVAGSSDRPVADGAPLRAIQFMVERASASGAPVGPAEAVTVDEALAAYTTGSAYACRVDGVAGHLAAGALADLAVLGADPREVTPSAIADVPVLATVLGGEVVHGAV
ncbi:amidohydrolase [Jiangella ureilytica]|uniref:Amidohydrolase n=1 Tax=Jiangella ureilytica TaxID=2530374 RepID=A0A4R4RCQ7_9ACTN|nr:amidohydrolase [Jiangella ureilytica]